MILYSLRPAHPILGGVYTRVTDLATPPQKRGVLLFDGTVTNAPFSMSYGSCGLFIGDKYPLCIISCVDGSGLSIFARSANSNGTEWSVTSSNWVKIV